MKQKRRFHTAILILVSLAAYWGSASGTGFPAYSSEGITAVKKRDSARKQQSATRVKSTVIAYYFHGNYRCYTCKKIEQYSREAIEKFYTRELNEKKVEFRPVNIDEKGNRHFIQDYRLYTRSLVIVLHRNDRQVRWTNLTDVWSHVRDREKFYQYVRTELDAMLREAK